MTTALLPEAHRAIRPVDTTESAIAGVLVADGAAMRVRVDVDTVPAELWRHGAGEHIAGVCDLVRRPYGHDALVPWCTERLSVYLARRTGAKHALLPGEAVTLAGSLLRGIEQAGTSALTGVWWLTDEGRPVFVPGDGQGIVGATVVAISAIRALTADRGVDRVLAELERMPEDPRAVQRRLAGWEAALTEQAAPRALDRDIRSETPSMLREPSGRIEPDTGAHPSRRGRRRSRPEKSAHLSGWRNAALSTARDSVDRARDVLRSMRARGKARGVHFEPDSIPPQARRRSEGRPHAARPRLVAVAAAVGVVVVAVGLLWPRAEAPSHADETDASLVPVSTPSATMNSAPESPPVTSGEDDAVDAAAALLEVLDGCRENGDQDCVAAVVSGRSAQVFDALMADLSEMTVTPVEEYGDVAVVRATSATASQILVLLHQNDSWLVRDVYDVANQP